MKTERINMKIDKQLKEQATTLAPDNNLSMLVRNLLREYIEKNKEKS